MPKSSTSVTVTLVASLLCFAFSVYVRLFRSDVLPAGVLAVVIGFVLMVVGAGFATKYSRSEASPQPRGRCNVASRLALDGAIICLVIVCLGSFVTSWLVGSGGEASGGRAVFDPLPRYYLNSHGRLTEVERWRYLVVGVSSCVVWHSAAVTVSLCSLYVVVHRRLPSLLAVVLKTFPVRSDVSKEH
jgi:hypothetical protein